MNTRVCACMYVHVRMHSYRNSCTSWADLRNDTECGDIGRTGVALVQQPDGWRGNECPFACAEKNVATTGASHVSMSNLKTPLQSGAMNYNIKLNPHIKLVQKIK